MIYIGKENGVDCFFIKEGEVPPCIQFVYEKEHYDCPVKGSVAKEPDGSKLIFNGEVWEKENNVKTEPVKKTVRASGNRSTTPAPKTRKRKEN